MYFYTSQVNRILNDKKGGKFGYPIFNSITTSWFIIRWNRLSNPSFSAGYFKKPTKTL